MTLNEFADWLENEVRNCPSEVQMKVSPQNNRIIRETLDWVIQQARMKTE